MKHALLSPSSSHRWIPCPGSVALSKDEPNPPSTYSDEGTAAHHVASETLTRGVQAQAFVGMMVGLWDEPEHYEKMFHPAPHGEKPRPSPRVWYMVDSEMAGHVQTYVDKIREYAKGNEMFVEQNLSTASITGEEDAAGTSDCVILAGDELQVHDLKYGMGNRVDATDNSQLKIYALAALEAFGFMADFKRVRLVAHQTRLEHLTEWDCSVEELKAWSDNVVQRQAHAALTLYEQGIDADIVGGPFFKAGDHCKTGFCPSRASCPTLAAYVAETVGAGFDVIPEIEAATGVIKTLPVATGFFEVLGTKLKAVDVIEDWCKAVRARVESVLIETHNDPAVSEALGYKLVQGRKGARSWVDELAAEAELKRMKLKEAEMYHKKLCSPTDIEKLLKKDSPKKWDKVVPLYAQKEGGPSVVLLEDKRPALVITPTAESFDNLEDEGGGLV
jgi:hypothetical protein